MPHHKHRHNVKDLHLLLCYKHYANHPGVSHIGLGVTATNIAKYLQCHGIPSHVFPVVREDDIEKYLINHPKTTHVHISALWVKTATLARWCALFPHVHFSITCHSNAAFLQSEPEAITLIREAINLEEMTTNFTLCGNNERFCNFIQNAYGGICTHIPNLYFLNSLHRMPHHRPWTGGTLRIGIFGAMRALKNFNTAAAAAVQIARELRTHTEIWINVARRDSSDADVVLRSVRNTCRGVPLVELKEYPWAPWPEFRKTVGAMNLLLQPSHSETFNNVTADGVAEGVPSVVSDTIEWAPKSWVANVDDVQSVARVGQALLRDPMAARDGYQAMHLRNEFGFHKWREFLVGRY